MSIKNKKLRSMSASGMLLIFSIHAFAQDEIMLEPPAPQPQSSLSSTIEEGAVTILSDQVHQIGNSLEGVAAVHVYSFTSARGQDVLLGTPNPKGFNSAWKIEYRKADGEWRLKRYKGPELLTSLQPGAKIDVRVSAVAGAQFDRTDYRLVFGSSPRMNYDLHHEEGFLKVPYGFTKPAFLATQAFKQALLEVTFTDSKGHPLEGGVVNFALKLPERPDSIIKTLVSDASGKASELLRFEACTGGNAADYFTHRSNGRNTWATRYKVGSYVATNALLEELADKPHNYNFGHICKRTLVNWSRN